jgi:hypothetical protein
VTAIADACHLCRQEARSEKKCMEIDWRHVALQRQQNNTSGRCFSGALGYNPAQIEVLAWGTTLARGIQEQPRLMPQQHPRRGTRG